MGNKHCILSPWFDRLTMSLGNLLLPIRFF